MKKYYIIILVVIIGLTVSIYFLSKDKANDNQSVSVLENQTNNKLEKPKWEDGFTKAGLDDLEINQKILVMGSENSNGSIIADRIIIGDNEIEFTQMGGDMERREINKENVSGEIDEEREEMRKTVEGRTTDGTRGNISVNTDQSVVRLIGEIIDIDDDSLTLKLDTSGSKIIFYSDSTEIGKFTSGI